jgi:signal transduction histidine kinase
LLTQEPKAVPTESLKIDPAAAADVPSELHIVLNELARAPIETFDLNSVLARLLNFAASHAGARSAYLKRMNGEAGRPGIIACSDAGPIALEGTVSSHTLPVMSLGVQVASLVLLHEVPPAEQKSVATATMDAICDGISLALRRANADEEIKRNQVALREAVETKYHLVGGVSVSLKNTLSVVAGYLQLLEMQAGLSPMQQDYVDRGRGAISMAVSLINELVELSRAEAGDLPIELDAVNLSTFVRDAAANHSTLSNAKRLLVNIDAPQRVPPVFTDPNYVREILDALLHNAVKYTPEAGCITVRLEQRDGRRLSDPLSWVCVTVQDTGPGIAEPEHLFEETKRAETRKTPMGFRLVICRRVARLLGGDLTLESAPGRGAKFTLWLPLATARP